MPEPLNLIRGLPDDGRVHLLETGPPIRVAPEGTASFLTQMGGELPWNTIWVGPGSHKAAKVVAGPIVNYIADPDLCSKALRIASVNAARLGRPWFNHPDRIIATTRERVAAALQGIDGLIVPRVVRCSAACGRDVVEAIAEGGLRYPVLLRSVGEHGGRTLVRVDGPDAERAFERAVAAGKDLYLTEFHDFADEDGLYRRYRLAVVGGEVFIKSVVMGAGWNLHASSRIWDDTTIAQERQIIDTFDTALAPRIRPVIDAIYDRLGLDYFGIDCAVRSDGSIVLFEANATMNILIDIKLQPDLWSDRTNRIKSALVSLLQDSGRWAVARPHPPALLSPVKPAAETRRPSAPPTGPTAADILARCADEQRLRDGLARSDAGQIADSYDTLHSVRLVTLILDSIPTTLGEEARARYLFFILARLFDANLAALCDWARDDVQDGRTGQAANTLHWIERLLRLKHEIGLFRPLVVPDPCPGEQPPASVFPPALEAFSAALSAFFDQAGFPAIGSEDAIESAEVMLFHRAKNIILLAKEDGLGPLPEDIAPDIVAAHLDCVAATAAGLAMNRPTHMGQFCLLHQVPELIVPTVLDRWSSIEASLDAADPYGALEHAQSAGDLLSIMVLSIEPLAEILYPSEYFKFRGNLGATSGSSSAALRGKLLTGAYVRLAERAAAASLNGTGRAHDRLMAQLARNRELLYKWRALHLALPRNVLGSDGTRSLVGSPDALKAVRTMSDIFAAKDPLTAIFGPVADAGLLSIDAVERLDAALLSETGRVARNEFWQVQERVGTWAKNKQNA